MRTYIQFYQHVEQYFNYKDRKGNTMKVLIGFITGLLFVLVIGAAAGIQKHVVTFSGPLESSRYQSTFSGMTPDGECYLAVTNTVNGATEIVKITKDLNEMFEGRTFERGPDGRAILKVQY
jgi:hypothetical protein